MTEETKNQNEWKTIVDGFQTTPYLFVGSGLTRRYLNLPDWEGLLRTFACRLSEDEFVYEGYVNRANGKLPQVGSLIEADFNNRWFNDKAFRTPSSEIDNQVKEKISPFKAEVAYFLKGFTNHDVSYAKEIATLTELTKSNISGFITTNYDSFLESISGDYKTYVGQEELLVSPIQEMAEVYKIHGSVDEPGSLIITQKDYEKFNSGNKYLAAKLMTIFVEYPIIFIGYSLQDQNIQGILKSIVDCLSPKNIAKLANKFVYVKHNRKLKNSLKISFIENFIGDKCIPMTQVETDNFQLIYDGLKNKTSGLPVRVLRFYKEQFYNYSITHTPSRHVVVNLFDPNIPLDQLCVSIGQNSQSVINGLVGISSEDWYKGVLYDNCLPYSPDDLFAYGFLKLFKQANALPVFKYIADSGKPYKDIIAKVNIFGFDDLISTSLKKQRRSGKIRDRSIKGIIKQCTEHGDVNPQVFNYIATLEEHEIDVNDLYEFLTLYLERYPDALSDFTDSNLKSSLKRAIRIYDWLKFHK